MSPRKKKEEGFTQDLSYFIPYSRIEACQTVADLEKLCEQAAYRFGGTLYHNIVNCTPVMTERFHPCECGGAPESSQCGPLCKFPNPDGSL